MDIGKPFSAWCGSPCVFSARVTSDQVMMNDRRAFILARGLSYVKAELESDCLLPIDQNHTIRSIFRGRVRDGNRFDTSRATAKMKKIRRGETVNKPVSDTWLVLTHLIRPVCWEQSTDTRCLLCTIAPCPPLMQQPHNLATCMINNAGRAVSVAAGHSQSQRTTRSISSCMDALLLQRWASRFMLCCNDRLMPF